MSRSIADHDTSFTHFRDIAHVMASSSTLRLLAMALITMTGLSGCGLLGAATGAAAKAVTSTIDVFVEAPTYDSDEQAITVAEIPDNKG